MKKRAVALLAALVLIAFVLPGSAFAAPSLSNFTKVNTYRQGQFSDVSNEWFAPYVQAAYEYGLMGGTSQTTFSPGSNLTIAEAVKLAACLHSIYNTGSLSFTSGTPWYQPYVDYALKNGILSSSYANYAVPATRSDFAAILAKALPDEALPSINTIPDNEIPDVSYSYSYGPAVYKLYRAGVLTGSDAAGTFYPSTYITRDSVAAIASRMASTVYRQKLVLSAKETSTSDIASLCTPAVFYIEVYGLDGSLLGNASGFFINSSGLAVTNFHVINGAASAKIRTKDGKIYEVSNIVDYNKAHDLALVQINGTGFPFLTLGDSGTAVTGSTIYAIGYPLGIDQTFTKGTITNASHPVDDVNCIMIDASISPGSSGGALLNSTGQVIGVTSGAYINGQNLNYAVPINLLKSLDQTGSKPMSSLTQPLNYRAIAYPSKVTVTEGSQTKVTIADADRVSSSASCVVADKSIVSYSWGYWSNKNAMVDLNIMGLKEGKTTVSVFFYDRDDTITAKTDIEVTVTRRAITTTPYYADYPAPDFGSYIGTPYYDSYFDDKIGAMFYLYRQSDINGDLKSAVNGYFTLLYNDGFTKTKDFSSADVESVIFNKPGCAVSFIIEFANDSRKPDFIVALAHLES